MRPCSPIGRGNTLKTCTGMGSNPITGTKSATLCKNFQGKFDFLSKIGYNIYREN